MNRTTYQKVYLNWINIPTFLGFSIPYVLALMFFYFLGAHGDELSSTLALFCGASVNFYIGNKLKVDIFVSFVSMIIGLITVLGFIILIQNIFGIKIFW